MNRSDLFCPPLSCAVVCDEGHRPGPEQCVCRDEIEDSIGCHVSKKAAHPRRFELEHAGGITSSEEIEDTLVIAGQAIQIKRVCAFVRCSPNGTPDGFVIELFSDQFLGKFDR